MSNSSRIEIWHTVEKRINGKPVKEKEILNKMYAEILSLYGNELYSALNASMENMLIFKVRYCKILNKLLSSTDWYITYNNTDYKLYYSDFSKYPKQYVLLKCKGIK